MDPSSDLHEKPTKHHEQSSTDLLSSARVVAEAAQATFSRETDKVDKAKVAGAAEDLLGAASQYGKLEERGFGQYVEKAEGYLHQYSTTSSAPGGTVAGPGGPKVTSGVAEDKPAPQSSADQEEEPSGNKYGEYFKMASGFLNK